MFTKASALALLLLFPMGFLVPVVAVPVAIYACFINRKLSLRSFAAFIMLANIALMAVWYNTFRHLGGP